MRRDIKLLFAVSFANMLIISLYSATRYVDINSTNPVYPYTSWETAATNLHQAVSNLSNGDMVLINPGTYYLTSQISLAVSVVVQGATTNPEDVVVTRIPTVTNRIFYLNNLNAMIANLTVSNGCGTGGDTTAFGGGVCLSGGIVSNCIITHNAAPRKGGGIGVGYQGDSGIIKNAS